MSLRVTTLVLAPAAGLAVTIGTAYGSSVEGALPYAPAQGPVLAGPRLLYVPSGQPAGSVRIEAAAGGRRTLVARLPGEPRRTDGGSFTGRSVTAAVAATATTLVANVTTSFDLAGGRSGDPGQRLTRVWAGRLGGPLAAVSGACAFPRALGSPAVDGDQVATEGMACGSLDVLDLADQHRRALPTAAVSPVVVAGSLNAWLEPDGPPDGTGPGAAVVADATGRELLRVPVPLVNGGISLTLDPDGTLALFGSVGHGSANAVAVASPAQPIARVLPTPEGSTVVGARLAHGRVAMLLVPRRVSWLTGGEIVVTDTSGDHVRTVLRGVGAYGQDGFSFDGQDVAAIANRCDDVLLVRAAADRTAANVPDLRPCALRLQRRPRWASTKLLIRLSCRGLGPCGGADVTVRLGGPRGTLLGHVTSDPSAIAAVPVRRALRRLLVNRRTRIWIRARPADSGPNPSQTTTTTIPPRPR